MVDTVRREKNNTKDAADDTGLGSRGWIAVSFPLDLLSYHRWFILSSARPACIAFILLDEHSPTCILNVYKDVDLVGWRTNQISSGCGSNPIHA